MSRIRTKCDGTYNILTVAAAGVLSSASSFASPDSAAARFFFRARRAFVASPSLPTPRWPGALLRPRWRCADFPFLSFRPRCGAVSARAASSVTRLSCALSDAARARAARRTRSISDFDSRRMRSFSARSQSSSRVSASPSTGATYLKRSGGRIMATVGGVSGCSRARSHVHREVQQNKTKRTHPT